MGTKYIRTEPLQDTFEVYQDEPLTLTVPSIYADPPIANILDIRLRQATGQELSADVSFSHNSNDAASSVQILTTDLSVGEHELVLESFD